MMTQTSRDWTPSALVAARDIALDFFPVTDAQIDAQTAIIRAVNAGDLVGAAEAMRRARKYATLTWRNLHADWLRQVKRYIPGQWQEC